MSVIRIAHIVNPVKVQEGNKSYLDIAQPITFKSMLIAQKYAHDKCKDLDDKIEISLYTAQFSEDREIIPEGFIITPDIGRSTHDVYKMKNPTKKLPLIGDIINKLYENSDAEYFVYTNADIGVRTDFYVRLTSIIKKGHDGICIHRQDLPKTDEKGILTVDRIDDILNMNCKNEHPGHDCIIFKRDIVPNMSFKRVFVGYPPVGSLIKCQVKNNSKHFHELRSQCRMTFHLGNDKAWEKSRGEYNRINMDEGKGLYSWR
jgi:hypothetical protein